MYYPKSQVQTGFYANQGEYVIAQTLEPYVGPYWKTSKGQIFSGESPNDSTSQLLDIDEAEPRPNLQSLLQLEIEAGISQPFKEGQDDLIIDTQPSVNLNAIYAALVGDPIDPYSTPQLPQSNTLPPTEQDYTVGEFRRYFCKKFNEEVYIETDKPTYDRVVAKDRTIEWELFLPFDLPWQLTGERAQVESTNRNLVNLTSQRKKLQKFAQFLKNDYLKYYRG